MNDVAMEDAALIQLISRGHTEALGELYDRYYRLVFSLALRSVGNRATAEEITQDVFISVWEKANTYRADRAKVSTWLTSIARYRSIDVLRRRGVRPEQHSVSWADVATSDIPSVEGPEESTAILLQQQRVRAAVARLPEEQQQVLALAYFLGYTQSQIAEKLDLPLGTVKTRIRLGMQKLRQSFQEEGSG